MAARDPRAAGLPPLVGPAAVSEGLCINPYTRSAFVVDMGGVSSAPPAAASSFSPQFLACQMAARDHLVPVRHWILMAIHVQEGRSDAAVATAFGRATPTLNVAPTTTHETGRFRAVLWARADVPNAGTPERNAIPGFALLDGAQPGVWWSGVAYMTLYCNHTEEPVIKRSFLEATLHAISWERVAGVNQLSLRRVEAGGREWATVPFCAACAVRLTDRPKRCARCCRVFYCGAACQHAHWRAHKKLCRAFVPL